MTAVLFAICLADGACAAEQKSASTSRPASVPAVVRIESSKYAFAADYPADWAEITKGNTFALATVPRTHLSDKSYDLVASLDIEIPKMPPHFPGMIPIGAVADGYVDDLKKHFVNVHVDERCVTNLAGVKGRRVVSSMTNRDHAWRDIAVLVCRNDRVYVLSADCAAEDYAKTRADFDSVVDSWEWK